VGFACGESGAPHRKKFNCSSIGKNLNQTAKNRCGAQGEGESRSARSAVQSIRSTFEFATAVPRLNAA
jgi:hypothetical protein